MSGINYGPCVPMPTYVFRLFRWVNRLECIHRNKTIGQWAQNGMASCLSLFTMFIGRELRSTRERDRGGKWQHNANIRECRNVLPSARCQHSMMHSLLVVWALFSFAWWQDNTHTHTSSTWSSTAIHHSLYYYLLILGPFLSSNWWNVHRDHAGKMVDAAAVAASAVAILVHFVYCVLLHWMMLAMKSSSTLLLMFFLSPLPSHHTFHLPHLQQWWLVSPHHV